MIEKCGIVLNGEFIEYENAADDKEENFKLPLEAFLKDPEAIWHTHPVEYPFLSTHDRVSQIATGLPWIVLSGDSKLEVECRPLLLGREFDYGVNDCGTIIEDAYHLCGIDLGRTFRADIERDTHSDYIIDSLVETGFYDVSIDNLQVGDVLVTAYNGKNDHMMLYVGDGRVVHHLYGRYSNIELLNSYHLKRVNKVVRHIDWNESMITAINNDLGASDYV